MKKFSDISGVKLNDKVIIEENNTEFDLRSKISYLVDSHIRYKLSSYLMPSLNKDISIIGDGDLVESLMSLLRSEDTKKEIKLLEEARQLFVSNNFSKVEDRLSELNLILERQTASMMEKHVQRVKDILVNGDYDMENCKRLAQTQANKIKQGEKSYYRGLTAEDMINDKPEYKKVLTEIANIFLFRSKQLGFKK